MRNTDYDQKVLDNIVSSDSSLQALFEIMDDLDLEISGIKNL